MDSKILKAIADSLPETQVKIIKDALIERDSLREELKAAKSTKDDYSKYWSDERTKNDKLEAELLVKTELCEKVVASNMELMAKDVEARVALAEGKLEAVNNTVDKFLKNTIYRESLQHQVVDEQRGSNMLYGNNGQQVPTPFVSKTNKEVVDRKERTTE
jgi:hypothetical protein